eukprot:CAMPEP_0201715516 /NCGR_PEP_ID=MMETSP0593-20130828/1682_1 /ASSEMBLY_ACC=CAM_ASM_000672 /TAXON_ID=267983 /ORGANISM="Skeletonema japonicum, Strain CCMP2506" /LENGTH=130 /DNA_ID=CAMNT_0048205033 /DNA_START=10 /DNA_END=405 /DNA_ORIENTATION=+
MSVRFDQVELRQYSNTASVHTKKLYPIDSFEAERKNRRRTMLQFHRSDLYREEIWVAKQKKEKEGRQIVEVDENWEPSTSDSIASEKIKKTDDKKSKQRSRRKHLFRRQNRRSSLKSSLMPIRESMSIVF